VHVDLAIELGVAPDRIGTIIDIQVWPEHRRVGRRRGTGEHTVGRRAAAPRRTNRRGAARL